MTAEVARNRGVLLRFCIFGVKGSLPLAVDALGIQLRESPVRKEHIGLVDLRSRQHVSYEKPPKFVVDREQEWVRGFVTVAVVGDVDDVGVVPNRRMGAKLGVLLLKFLMGDVQFRNTDVTDLASSHTQFQLAPGDATPSDIGNLAKFYPEVLYR